MFALIQKIEEKYKKPQIVDVRSGDTVRVHQKIQEGSKTRTQVFEGLVIRTRNMGSLSASILVRRISSGVGVEKGYFVNSRNMEKLEVIKRATVRRNYLSYMRQRGGKSARLAGVDFDKEKVNKANEKPAEPEVPVDTSEAAREAEKALAEEPKAEETSKAEEPEKDAEEKPAKADEAQDITEAKEEAKTEEPKPAKDEADDKAAAKKAKAEEFRKAQLEKK